MQEWPRSKKIQELSFSFHFKQRMFCLTKVFWDVAIGEPQLKHVFVAQILWERLWLSLLSWPKWPPGNSFNQSLNKYWLSLGRRAGCCPPPVGIGLALGPRTTVLSHTHHMVPSPHREAMRHRFFPRIQNVFLMGTKLGLWNQSDLNFIPMQTLPAVWSCF